MVRIPVRPRHSCASLLIVTEFGPYLYECTRLLLWFGTELRTFGIENERSRKAGDATYIATASGFLYLISVADLYGRYVLAWHLSNTLDITFCIEALWRPHIQSNQ